VQFPCIYGMIAKPVMFFLFFAMLIPGLAVAQLVHVENFSGRRVDSIVLERNWRTRDRIILAELEFNPGDTVTPGMLEVSLKKIWNLQNFASVDYRWDSLTDGRSVLVLVARDALTWVPVFGGNLYRSGFSATAGIADRNFLGRNIRLEIRGKYSPDEPVLGEVKLNVPRQLLWKNMSVGAGVRKEQVMGVLSDRVFLSVVNPFHTDYRYTFSPDIETGYDRRRDWHRPGEEPPDITGFDHRYWYFRVLESIGTVTHRRHQEEGFSFSCLIGGGVGLNSDTRSYLEAGLQAEYHRLLSPRLQFSARWEVNFSPHGHEYLWPRYGPSNIRGLKYGDLSGPLMQLASTGLYYTWLNRDYLAIEQSLFMQYGSARQRWENDAGAMLHYAFGTGFRFTVPMYPAASLLVSFSLNPNRMNWFYLEL
jgi:hypothetical protein